MFTGSVTGGTPPYGYTFFFGDGASASGTNGVTHAYATSGMYTVVFDGTDSNGKTFATSTQISVTGSGSTVITFIVTVVSSYSGGPVSGVNVVLTGPGTYTSVTNSFGQAIFNLNSAGPYQATFTAIGYNTLKTTFPIASSGSASITLVPMGPCCSILGGTLGGVVPEAAIGVLSLVLGAFLFSRKRL